MPKRNRLSQRPLLLAVIGLLAVLPAACSTGGGGDLETATLAPEATAPAGWQAFDRGAMSGGAPAGWTVEVLTAEDFVRLAKEGLSSVSLSKEARKVTDKLGPDDVSKQVMVLIGGDDGFPNVNVQPCFEGARPASAADGPEVAKTYAKGLGLAVESTGDVTMAGMKFALFKVHFFSQFDSYQAFVGTSKCASIVTLTTHGGDSAPLSDFRTFMELLKVTR